MLWKVPRSPRVIPTVGIQSIRDFNCYIGRSVEHYFGILMFSAALLATAGFLGSSTLTRRDEVSSLGPNSARISQTTYDFPILGKNASDLFPMRPCRGFPLEEASIDDIQGLLVSRALSSVDLVSCYLDRVYQTSSYLKYALNTGRWH